MFIALTRDQATQSSIRHLLKQFPGEVLQTLNQIIRSDYDLTSLKENPITRITILGHADQGLYGGMDSETFADHLIHILKKNDEASPGFSNRLEAIDLLGCELGFINAETQSYAMEVATHLQKKGYSIPIQAFTIPEHTKSHFVNTLLNRKTKTTLHNEATTWGFYGFKTAEDTEKYITYTSLESEVYIKKIREQAKLYTLIETIRNVNIENIALETTIDDSYIQLQRAKINLQTPENKSKIEHTLVKFRQKISDSRAMIQKNIAKLSILYETQKKLTTYIDQLEKKEQMLSEHRLNCSVQIVDTSNPREYLDQHPECDFTHLAQIYRTETVDTLVNSKQSKQIEHQELTKKIHTLETQSVKWQRSLEKANLTIEQKRSEIDSPEAETEFIELMVGWQEQIVARQLTIKHNTAAIRELSQTQQQISAEIEELDTKLTELTQPHQNAEKAVSDIRNTVQMVRRYKTSIPREKIDPKQSPLHDSAIKPNSNRQ
ncbi:MAG: hypothetical protein KBB94_01365 [Legionellaceae bacterium]|nr:hypothetical protein [Legionellaceae bacterium]MBP9774647.1 hypothetical protein [Legionellaceae bacterium]